MFILFLFLHCHFVLVYVENRTISAYPKHVQLYSEDISQMVIVQFKVIRISKETRTLDETCRTDNQCAASDIIVFTGDLFDCYEKKTADMKQGCLFISFNNYMQTFRKLPSLETMILAAKAINVYRDIMEEA